MRIVVVRNGAVIREYRDQALICDDCWNGAIWNNNDDENKMRYETFSVNVGIPLLKNDKVWVEAYCSKFDEEVSGMEVQADPKGTWFSGHLVNRL